MQPAEFALKKQRSRKKTVYIFGNERINLLKRIGRPKFEKVKRI
jgi:hypothetical protein